MLSFCSSFQKFIFKSTYISEQELNILDKGAQETPSLAPSFRGIYSGCPSALPTSHHHGSQDLAGARRHAKSSPVTSLSFLDHFFQPSVFCPHSSEPTPGPLWPFSSGPFSQSGSHDVCAPRPAGWLRENSLQRHVEQAYIWTEMFMHVFIAPSSPPPTYPMFRNRAEGGGKKVGWALGQILGSGSL